MIIDQDYRSIAYIAYTTAQRQRIIAQLLDVPGAVLLSRALEQEIIDQEIRDDDSDFCEGGIWKGRLVGQYLNLSKEMAEFLEPCLNLLPLVSKSLIHLSAGELRKVVLAKVLDQQPDILILDHPCDSLDIISTQALLALISQMQHGEIKKSIKLPTSIILFCESASDVPSGMPNKRAKKIEQSEAPSLENIGNKNGTPPPALLVQMHNVRVSYDDEAIIDGLDWTVAPGQHTRISGPNGCGKTTLLRLINGDHPQVYANRIQVCGYWRGNGESIWDIKKHIGYFSGLMHRDYLRVGAASVQAVLVSGLRDSIGLYGLASEMELQEALDFLKIFGLETYRNTAFSELNAGLQREVLIARSAIKRPHLLILDEPCTSLELTQRQRVLDVAAAIAQSGSTTLLHVSHDPTEWITGTRHTLEFIAMADKFWPSGRPFYQIRQGIRGKLAGEQ